MTSEEREILLGMVLKHLFLIKIDRQLAKEFQSRDLVDLLHAHGWESMKLKANMK